MLKPATDSAEGPGFLDRLFAGLDDAAGFGLAVSGGPDSMALMAMFAVWHQTRNDRRPVLVLTVDHGLRPEAADECALVADTAAELGLQCRVLNWRPAAGTPVSQANAREGRYRLMARTMEREGLTHLLVAHHRDDQAETVLMRLFNGSGLDGLAGMARENVREGVAIVRPLLGLSRSDLRTWAKETRIPFADDPSNTDPQYERARLRRLMPQLAEAGGTPESIVRFSRRAERARDALEQVAAGMFDEAASVDDFGVCRLSLPALAAHHPELRWRIIRQAMAAVRGRTEYRLERLERVEAALFDEGVGGLTLSGCRFARKDDVVTVVREARNLPRQPQALPAGATVVFDDRFEVTAGNDVKGTLTLAPLGDAGWRTARERFDVLPPVVEAARAALPAVWRSDRLIAIPGAGATDGIQFAFVAPRMAKSLRNGMAD